MSGKLKSMLESNPVVTVVFCVFVIAAVAYYLFVRGDSRGFAANKWMFDLNTGKLLVMPQETLSPSDLGSGVYPYPGMKEVGAVVDAVIYSCDESVSLREGMLVKEIEDAGAFIGYLSRWPDRGLARMEKGEIVSSDEVPMLISSVEGDTWVSSESPGAAPILSRVSGLCGGKLPTVLRP